MTTSLACAAVAPTESHNGDDLPLGNVAQENGVAPPPVEVEPEKPLEVAARDPDRFAPLVAAFRPAADDILRDLAAWNAATPAQRTARASALLPQLRGFVLSGLLRFDCGTQHHQVAVFRHDRTGLEFVLVPCGSLAAAVPGGLQGTRYRAVAVDAPFLIARTEVTRRILKPEATDDAAEDGSAGLDVAAGGVSADEAILFCRANGFDLPSEAQWEFACRAGAETRYCHGSDPAVLDAYAWTSGSSGGRLRRVGEKLPNAFGIFDLHGNAREWTRDADPDSDLHFLIGEGADAPASARSRIRRDPDAHEWMHGFRPVVTIGPRTWAPAPGIATLRVLARGVQTYRLGRGADGKLKWIFVGPRADLVDGTGRVVGSHFLANGQPCWQVERNCIYARKAVERPSGCAGSIPELQLDVTGEFGDGPFDGASTIERLGTEGGAAPAVGASHAEGDTVEVPYTATYVFYGQSPPRPAETDVVGELRK